MSPQPDSNARETRRLWLLAVGVRQRWDLRVTGMRGRLTYYGALAGLFLGVVGLVAGTASWDWVYLASLLGFALSAILFFPEWTRIHRPDIALVATHLPGISRAGVAGGTLVRLPGLGQRKTNQFAVAWDEVDALLPDSLATCDYTRTMRKLSQRVGRFTYSILLAKSQAQNIFNGKLVRQDDDLTPELLASGGSVGLSQTDYFSTICSNYLAGWRVIDRRTGSTEADGADLFLRDGRLLPLSANNQANPIGVSTLAFTSDGKLVLTLQNPKSASSPGLLAPAGSGSVDLRSVRRLRSGDRSLVGFLAAAMQRELVEEAHIRYRDIEWTEVLGYFRWIDMGGKPEYVGVTKLKASSDDLAGRDVRMVEIPFVQRLVFDCQLDLVRLRKAPENLNALEDRFRGGVSMPLFMSLRALGRALNRDDALATSLSALASSQDHRRPTPEADGPKPRQERSSLVRQLRRQSQRTLAADESRPAAE